MISPTSALKSKNYLIYLVGATISLHGLWIYRVALGWYSWEMTHSELWVGIIAATQFAPAVIFGPIFGVLADRFDRRATSVLINSVSVFNMLVLGLLTSLGFMDIRVLMLLSLMQGILDGAHAPVRMSIVPNLVTREQLPNAIALTSISFNLSRVIGPAIAGLIIAVFGVATAFTVNGVSYIGMVVAMCLIRLFPSGKNDELRKHHWTELVDGASYCFTNPTLRGLLLVAALSSVFGRGALEMLPAFADQVYRGGPEALAILTSAIGGGAILVGLVMSRDSGWINNRTIRLGLTVSGLLVILLGAIDNFAAVVVIVVGLGVTLSICGIGSQILIQIGIDDDFRGRVSSFWGMIAFGGTSLGSLLVGITAHFWGLQPAVIAAGALCALFSFPGLKRLSA